MSFLCSVSRVSKLAVSQPVGKIDVSRDVATLFRILQRHYPQFMETLKFQITSRREFERLAACNPDTLTDLERAGRFLHLQRLAFGGKVAGPNLGVDSNGPSRFDVTKLGPLLDEIHERLAGVVIKCLAWADFAGGERTLKGSPIPRQLSRFPILRDGRKAPIEIGAFLKYLKIQSAMCAMPTAKVS